MRFRPFLEWVFAFRMEVTSVFAKFDRSLGRSNGHPRKSSAPDFGVTAPPFAL